MMMNVILILVVVLLATVIIWLIRATDNNNLEQPKLDTEPIKDVANDEPSLFVQRLPILNNQQKVIGYQLIVNSTVESITTQTGHFNALVAMISHYDFAELASDKKAYLKVSADVLENADISLFPANETVFMVDVTNTQSFPLEACKRLHQQGYKFAVLVKNKATLEHPLVEISDYVVIDDRGDSNHLHEWVAKARGKRLRIIVSHVHKQAQFERIQTLGVNGYQGYYFSEPETLDNTRIGPQVEQVMQLFNLVSSQAPADVIEQAFKVDTVLTFNLLRYINSAGFGIRNEVSSIKSALLFLGYEKMARWLAVLMAASDDMKNDAQEAVFEVATIRGRLMELLGDEFSEKEQDALFMTGMFSLLDTMLGMSLEKAIANLQLPEDAVAALLQKKGRFYDVLSLAIACEKSAMSDILPLAEKLGLTLAEVNKKQLLATQWAHSLQAG
ncbi:hypothetical protein A9Q78_02275 [Methylophaga sp. 41_12_T18]|mgnify:FL=1|nr:hypothetical protein A9Q78_02275 [Methylophaga sp. 41_12_T18]